MVTYFSLPFSGLLENSVHFAEENEGGEMGIVMHIKALKT